MPDLSARFWGLTGRARFLIIAILGIVAGLGQAPLDLWPATVLALAAAFTLYPANGTAKQAAIFAWFFGLGYFGFTLRWIVEPFLVDIVRHGWMAPFALVFMASGAALFWAIAAYAARRLSGGVVQFALLLIWVEIARSLILTGFPWVLLGHIWIPTSLSQLSAFGGPHLLTGITVLAALAVMMLGRAGRVRWVGLAVVGVLLAGALTLRVGPSEPVNGPVVRLVQPNAPQHQKWDPAYRDQFLTRMLQFSAQGDVPDLIVWPETSVPTLLNYLEQDTSVIADAARGAPLIFGIQRRDELSNYYNSLVVLRAGGVVGDIYDKRHLVPFGEYIPGAGLLGRAGATGLAKNLGSGFKSGAHPGPVDLPGIGAAIPLICYEGIFAEEIATGADRARLIVLITNDAWFGQAVGPYQHLAQARLRAIEQGLPLVRAANTGVSAMIDAKGRVTATIPLGEDGAVDAALPPALPETLYSRWGDWPVFGLLLIMTLGAFIMRSRDND